MLPFRRPADPPMLAAASPEFHAILGEGWLSLAPREDGVKRMHHGRQGV